MVRSTKLGLRLMTFVFVVAMPVAAWAQSQTGIAGIVRDTTGGALPGVTVEAGSPALIERVRTAVTNESGAFRLTDLRPGVYSVTFTLPGFRPLRREAIELTTDFTATLNVTLGIGDLEETVVVSGQSPTVDLQSVVQTNVLTSRIVDAAPTARTMEVLALALVPGMVAGGLARPTGQDVGGTAIDSRAKLGIHGGRTEDMTPMIDGVPSHATTGVSAGGINMDAGAIGEWSYELGALSAERTTGGVQVNQIPRDGANQFSYQLFTAFTNSSLQSNNLSDELVRRGLPETNRLNYNWDFNPSMGGPIVRDKLWFYASARSWGTEDYVAGMWYDARPLDFTFTPDLSNRAVDDSELWSYSVRPTWQVTPRNKIGVFLINQGRCLCHQGVNRAKSPEASPRRTSPVDHLEQMNWSAPLTSRVLLEGSVQNYRFDQWNNPHANQSSDTIGVRELSTNLDFRAARGYSAILNRMTNARGAVAYVTGSHASKMGVQWQTGRRRVPTWVNQSVVMQLLNGQPRSVVQFATPYDLLSSLDMNLGVFVQDQWTMNRMTLNLGVRYDQLIGSVPPQSVAATPFLPARSYDEVNNVPNWKDLSPRLGVNIDLFGTGKTSVKATLSRYVAGETVGFAQNYNAIARSVNNVTRTWSSPSGTFNPFLDCDLTNPRANGSCGQINNLNFGTPTVTTTYNPDVERGFGRRQYSWETTAGIQHELLQGMSLSANYFRRAYGNFIVTDNRLVTPADFDPFCIVAPTDSRLPNGGGYEVCGLYDIKPAQFARVQDHVTYAKDFGQQSENYNGVDVTIRALLPRGTLINGGWNIGRSVTNNCFVVDSPQQLLNCEVKPPFKSQIKLLGSYQLPWGFSTSATYQNIPGPEITADYVATAAQIRGLGRNLSQGATGTVTVPLYAPGTSYEPSLHQLDLRFSKLFRLGRTRIQGNFDLYNALNDNSVLVVSGQYGPQWQQPGYVLPGRLLKFGAQIDF